MKAMLGKVGLVVYLTMVSAIMVKQAPAETLVGDLTGDGLVDLTDFLLLARNFGKSADDLLSPGHRGTIGAANNNTRTPIFRLLLRYTNLTEVQNYGIT